MHAAVFSECGATTAFPKAVSLPGIQVGEQIGVRSFSVVIQAQIQSPAIHHHVAGSETTDGDVVDEARSKIKSRDQIIAASQGNTMVSGALLIVERAR